MYASLHSFQIYPMTQCKRYNGKVHNHIPKLSQLLQGLRDKSLSPAKVIVIQSHENSHKLESSWTSWTDFRALGKQQCLGQTEDGEIRWHRASFDWPLWILFSSGTTGWSNSYHDRVLLHHQHDFI